MHRIFLAHMRGDRSQAALAEAGALAAETGTCLLCFERDPTHCHRSLVAGMISDGTGLVVHRLHASIDLPEPKPKRSRRTPP